MLKIAVSVPRSNLSFYRPVSVFTVFSHWALMTLVSKHPKVSPRHSCSLVNAAQLLKEEKGWLEATSSVYCHVGMYNQSIFVDTNEAHTILLGCEKEISMGC